MGKLKKITVLIMALAACLTFNAFTCAEMHASALTIIASIKNVTVKTDVIAIGSSVQLELEWGNGAQHQVVYSSSNPDVAEVSSTGLVTGISEGTARIDVAPTDNRYVKSVTITVSEDAVPSVTYNTSELILGKKLYKNSTLHYDNKNVGMAVNVVNSKKSFDVIHLLDSDYTLTFNVEVVGIDGLVLYLAPEYDDIQYIDARNLKAGDVIPADACLLCYDYVTNGRVLPVFLPEYYAEYVGEGTIKVKSIDNDSKRITLEAVYEEKECFTYEIKDGSIIFNSKAMLSYIIASNDKYTLERNKSETVFTPQANSKYVLTVNEFRESIISVNDSHFHYFYPVIYNYVVNVVGSEITMSKQGSRNFYSSEQVKEVQDSMLDSGDIDDTFVSVCFDVYAENSDIMKNGSYFAYLNCNAASRDNCYIATEYTEYSTNSYFCVKTHCKGCNGELPENPLVTVSDKTLAEISMIHSSSGSDGNLEFTTSDMVDLYMVKALKDGSLTVSTDENNYGVEIKNGVFMRTDNTSPVIGDSNSDGKLNAADIVILQKYLTGKQVLTDIQIKCSDINGDGKVNVFDAIAIKRMLISEYERNFEPALLMTDVEIYAIGSKHDTTAKVIGMDGTLYSAKYEGEFFDFDPENLSEQCGKIVSSGKRNTPTEDESVVNKIREFSQNAAKYKDCKMVNFGWYITDIGYETVYVPYKDENGSTQLLELGHIGSSCAWLDNPEVQDFIDMLVDNGFFNESNKYIYEDSIAVP